MEAAPHFLPHPLNRAETYSPSNSTVGSDWSGMNTYNGGLRPDAYPPPPPQRGDSISPPDIHGNSFEARPPNRAQTFAAVSPVEQYDRRGPSENGSRASSRAGSSRNSDMSLRDPRSQRYQRAESELRQHYAVLRAYLKGSAAQPPRANKARDKLLRLSPVQFHELSTDVFDELQRRQAAQPLPGRPPRMDKVPPFLQPRPDFHEKRNQARQKLSSLQIARFRDLATDVFCELERRFPHFNPENKRESTRSLSRGPAPRVPNGMPPALNGFGPPSRSHTANTSISSNAGLRPRNGSIPQLDINASNEFGRPMPKQFQSNTITPNKSTMIEDEDDDNSRGTGSYSRSSDAFALESSLKSSTSNRDTSATSMTGASRDTKSVPQLTDDLQNRVADLESKLEAKDVEINELSSAAMLKDKLQQQVDQVESLNSSLREEIEKLRIEHASLASQVAASDDNGWENKHNELEEQHQRLQSKYDQQMKMTDEVSKQFRAHMAEMRAMADEGSDSMQREEQLHGEVQRLKEEVAEWKARYTKVRSQKKDARLSTVGLNNDDVEKSKVLRDQSFYSSDGLVSDVHLTRFQLSINELLNSGHGPDPAAVLNHVKDLVYAVRSITGDVEKAMDGEKDDELARKRRKMKAKVSATANNVITASKNYAAAHGISPVSLLDAAASHLTAAVVDLLRNVRIRPTPIGEEGELTEHDDQHLTPVNKNGYFKVNGHVRKSSEADSVYSALSDPLEPDPRTPVGPVQDESRVDGNNYGLGIDATHLQQDDIELEELKVYLGNQTDVLVQNVQTLVRAVRDDGRTSVVRDHANGILDVVDIILAAAEGGMEQPTSFRALFVHKVSGAYEKLSQGKIQLENEVQNSTQHDGQPAATGVAQSFPPLAFQVAKAAKDLTADIEKVVTGEQADADDFS
ncbi:component of the polarisome [Lithohypha guttulata]|nr:component of the polarisome [Lithohypha guttulata]